MLSRGIDWLEGERYLRIITTETMHQLPTTSVSLESFWKLHLTTTCPHISKEHSRSELCSEFEQRQHVNMHCFSTALIYDNIL